MTAEDVVSVVDWTVIAFETVIVAIDGTSVIGNSLLFASRVDVVSIEDYVLSVFGIALLSTVALLVCSVSMFE